MAETIPLWPNRPRPDLTVSLSETKDPIGGVLVCPGGGYQHLAVGHEGADMLAALSAAGFDAAMLRYRLGPHNHHPAMIHDAARGMRLFRQQLEQAGRLKRVAVLGFSAGGHLAATLAVHHDSFPCDDDDLAGDVSARPDAAVLCYPVIDMAAESAHLGSIKNLLGERAEDEAQRALMSPHRHVDAESPPTFLWHTVEDAAVAMEDSVTFATACRAHGVPFELHLYERGRHGLGLAPELPDVASWFGLATAFLQRHLDAGDPSNHQEHASSDVSGATT